jgi:hypothetical protein
MTAFQEAVTFLRGPALLLCIGVLLPVSTNAHCDRSLPWNYSAASSSSFSAYLHSQLQLSGSVAGTGVLAQSTGSGLILGDDESIVTTSASAPAYLASDISANVSLEVLGVHVRTQTYTVGLMTDLTKQPMATPTANTSPITIPIATANSIGLASSANSQVTAASKWGNYDGIVIFTNLNGIADLAANTSHLAVFALAQSQETKLTPRDLFNAAAPPPADVATPKNDKSSAPAAAPLNVPLPTVRPAIRSWVLRRQPDGQFLGVDPSTTVFSSGDQVRIRIEANQAGYVYIFQRGSSGRLSMLFPSAAIDSGQNRVPALQPCEVPGQPGRGFVLDDRPGEEEIFVGFSLRRVNEDPILASLDQPPDSEVAAQSTRGSPSVIAPSSSPMQSRDLFLEKIVEHLPEEPEGIAIYATTSATKPESILLVRFRLIHLKAGGK